MSIADYVVTEAGFGADLGAEKFIDIKCRRLGLSPDAVVIVATLRALKYHGGATKEEAQNENLEALSEGLENLEKHISNIKGLGLNPIVAINRFPTDTENELNVLQEKLEGICEFSLLENWAKGSEGSKDLAEKVANICEREHNVEFTYDVNDSTKEKIEKVAKKIYGASGVEYSEEAEEQIKEIDNKNIHTEICIAKTQYSLSDDPKNLQCKEPFNIHITSVEYKAGAEFIVVKTGKVMTMPGLPKVPSAESIDLDEDGNIIGIF